MNKNNKRPELIISLAGVVGHARRVLSENIQRNLYKLGYKWNMQGEDKYQHLDAEVLHVCTPEWNPTHITYESEGPASAFGEARFFNGATEVEDFLEAAKNALIEKVTIEGVEVTITPNDVKLDLTAISTRVATEAKRVQDELFGRGSGC